MVLPFSFGWRDKVDGVEWEGVLACEPCSNDNPSGRSFTPHTGYRAKRVGTLYRLPVMPLGQSSVGFVACDRCGDGSWYKGDAFQELGREAARIAAEWGAQKNHQEDIRRREEAMLGVDAQRQLGLSPYGEGYLVKDWRGDERYVRLEAVLRHPENFILNEQQTAFAKGWQEMHPEGPKRPRYCTECGHDIANGGHSDDCDAGVVLS